MRGIVTLTDDDAGGSVKIDNILHVDVMAGASTVFVLCLDKDD